MDGTTIVEKGEMLTARSVLLQKIQRSIQPCAIGDPDSALFRRLVESASDGLYTLGSTGE